MNGPRRVRLVVSMVAAILLSLLIAGVGVLVPAAHYRFTSEPPGDVEPLWPVQVPPFWGNPQFIARGTAPAATALHFEAWLPRGRFEDYYAAHVRMTGWPWPAMRTSWRLFAQSREAMTEGIERLPRRSGIVLSRAIAPLWPGFALDTLFYGTLVFLLWSAPGFARRRSRRRRGACPACGYDLRGSGGEKCPECGGYSEQRTANIKTGSRCRRSPAAQTP